MINMKIIFYPLLLLGINVYAQQTYFSHRYNLDNYEVPFSVLQDGNNYIVGMASTSQGSKLKTSLSSFDSIGTHLWTKFIESPSASFYPGDVGSLIKTTDGGFAIAGTISDSIDTASGALYKFDVNGDSVWTVSFGDTAFQKFNQVKQTWDGGYILIGGSSTIDYWQDVWLVKTDSVGNVEWQKYFGLPNVSEEGYSVVQTTDGGYFLGGERFYFSTENGDWNMIKTDSVGNFQWERLFGGQYKEICKSVLQTQDGNLVGGGYYTIYCLNPHNGSPFCQPNIIKLDTAGNLLWNKKYGPVKYDTGLYSICETSSGDLVGAGTYYVDDSSSTFQYQGIVLKVNSNGDSLWYRNYAFLHQLYSDNILYDIRSTSDGGLIACGWLDPSLPDTGFIDSWLLKLDSMGCDTANCWMYVGVEDNQIYDHRLVICPNPSPGIFHIQTKEKIEKLEVFSYTGEKIILNNADLYEIDLCHAATGIYIYKITTSMNKVFLGKIVKD
jgi:hypothetical protein